MTTEQYRLQHLKDLLEARHEEYGIFGETAADIKKDAEILREIKELEANQEK
jgi:hypothetical protein